MGAAETPRVPAGTRVHVLFRTERARQPYSLHGTLAALGRDSVTVKPDGEAAAVVVRSEEVLRLERLVRGHRKKGAVIGASLLGGGMGVLMLSYCTTGWGCEGEEAKALAVVGVSAGLGALIGATVAPGDRWKEIRLGRGAAGGHRSSDPRVGVSVAPRRRGGAVALTLRF